MKRNTPPPFLLTFMLIIISMIIIFTPKVTRAEGNIPAQIYRHDSGRRIKAKISFKGVTRINFGSYGIKEVIGDESKYNLIASSDGGNVFITAKCSVGDVIDLTLVDVSHKIQDLSLVVSDIPSQTIIINKDFSASGLVDIRDAEVAELLQSMISSNNEKYYVNNQSETIYLSPELEVTKRYSYGYKLYNLYGVILQIRNITTGSLKLSELNVDSLFKNILVASFSDKELVPGAYITVYLVMNENRGSHD